MTRETVLNAAVGAYGAILLRYAEYKPAASRYESPNPEDDDFAKLAIAGFSSIAPIGRWSWEHLVAIRKLRAGIYQTRLWHGMKSMPASMLGSPTSAMGLSSPCATSGPSRTKTTSR
jgi:hypothetical protein